MDLITACIVSGSVACTTSPASPSPSTLATSTEPPSCRKRSMPLNKACGTLTCSNVSGCINSAARPSLYKKVKVCRAINTRSTVSEGRRRSTRFEPLRRSRASSCTWPLIRPWPCVCSAFTTSKSFPSIINTWPLLSSFACVFTPRPQPRRSVCVKRRSIAISHGAEEGTGSGEGFTEPQALSNEQQQPRRLERYAGCTEKHEMRGSLRGSLLQVQHDATRLTANCATASRDNAAHRLSQGKIRDRGGAFPCGVGGVLKFGKWVGGQLDAPY